MWRAVIFSLAALLSGCGPSPDEKSIERAVQSASAAFERNIPAGQKIVYGPFSVIETRHGAVCGSASVSGQAPERFWVGGTNDGGKVSPVLERWDKNKAEGDARFAQWCEGMAPVPDALAPASGVGAGLR